MSERVLVEGRSVLLRPDDFVAAGGQGRVFAHGDVAIKLFDDAAAVPPPDKLDQLRALRGPHVAAPEHDVLDSTGARVGYTMPFFSGADAWGQLCTPAYRRRVGLTDRDALELVRSLGAALTDVHGHGITVVDLSDNNVLVRDGALCLIDVDSWQTPGHRPTAITPGIASPHAAPGVFDASTDWFAFAVLASMLLLGIHPFKGKHPQVRGLAARMRAGISVFDPAVRVPAICRSPTQLPAPLAAWLRGALERGESTPPPLGPLPSPRPNPVHPDGQHYPGEVRDVLLAHEQVWVATRTAAFVDTRCWHDDGRPVRALGRTHEGHPFVLQERPDGGLELRAEPLDVRTPVELRIDALLADHGTVFARCHQRLLALEVRCLGTRPHLLPREVGRVLPWATHLFPGVALQNVMGRWHATWLGHPRGAPQYPLPDLDVDTVLDARRSGDRFVLLGSRDGQTARHEVWLEPTGAVRSHHVEHDAQPWGTVFVATGSGVYVEVGPKGAIARSEGAISPWTHPLADPSRAELHADTRRLLVSTGTSIQEIRGPGAAPSSRIQLGFDASRCR